jgi:hypothetical protein
MTSGRRTVHSISKPLRALCFALAALTSAIAPLAAHAAAAPTTTALTILSANHEVTSVASGTTVVLEAVVTPTAIGLVKFCDTTATYCTDQHLLGTGQVTSSGIASYTFIPGSGQHSYKAIFVGTSTHASSTSATTPLTVSPKPISMAVTATGAPGNYTLAVTLAGGLPAATGNVSFLDTTNANSALGTIALNPAAPTFAAPYTPPNVTAFGARAVTIGDFRNRGITDLVVANERASIGPGNAVTVFLGNGDGTFNSGVTYGVGTTPESVAVGDFNSDGLPDIVTANNGDNTVSVLLGNGDGTFRTAVTYSINRAPNAVVVGDFNGDGIPDLVTANIPDETLSVLLGNGDGTFKAPITHSTNSVPTAIAAGDFNGDGVLDLATVPSESNIVNVMLGNGDGTFKAGVAYEADVDPYSVAVGDFNGDGIPDLVTGNVGSVTVLLGNGDGTFKAGVRYVAGNISYSVAVGDFDGDGFLDIAAVNSGDDTVAVLLGKGDGTFKAATPYALVASPISLAVGDFNGDGHPDLATADLSGAPLTILLDQFPTAATATLTGVVVPGGGTHVIDASHAGDRSYSPSLSGNTVALIGTQISTTLTLSSSLSASAFGQQVVLTAKLSPYNSNNLSTNAETVVFQSNGANIGTGSLSSGVAVLNITALPVGTDAVTAVYGGDQNFITSVSTATTVTVAQTEQTPTLTFAPIANQTTGANPFTVSATSTSPGAVTYAVTSGPATISGATVTVLGVGTVVLAATQAAAGGYTAATTTTSFTVTAPGVVPDFTLASGQSAAMQTVNAGAATTYSLQLAPTGGAYPNTVSFTASGLPNGASFNFSPALVPANSGPVTVNFTVDTSAAQALNRAVPQRHPMPLVALGLLLLPLVGIPRFRKIGCKAIHPLLILLLAGAAMAVAGCSGGGSEERKTQTSSITITATSGAISHSTTVTLTTN